MQECNCEKQDFHCEYGFEKERNSVCKPMSLAVAPECKAITDDKYKMSETHLRLGHGMSCPNLKSFISDTNGNVCTPCPPRPGAGLAARRFRPVID